ncbi:MAG: NAD(P)-dependent oxidoreductase [Pseudomonadota bacterium]
MSDANDPQRPMQGLASLPVFFDLRGKRVVLAGGAAGAAWKAELLQAAGAKLDVVGAEPGPEMRALAAQVPALVLIARQWQEDDLAGAALAVGDFATDAEAARFAEAARRARVPINIIDKPKYCDFQFGTIIDRSPLIAAISTGGAAPVFALALRGRLEALMPPSLKAWAKAAQVWRPKLTDPQSRRRFWELFVARALTAQEPRDADFDALIEMAQHAADARKGAIAILGIAAHDPELLTLKALRLLQAADIVFYDTRVPPQIVEMARRESIKIDCAEEEAIAPILAEAQQGKRVVWLTTRDPASIDLGDFRAAGLDVETV